MSESEFLPFLTYVYPTMTLIAVLLIDCPLVKNFISWSFYTPRACVAFESCVLSHTETRTTTVGLHLHNICWGGAKITKCGTT